MSENYFVTSTGTEIGKTIASRLLVESLLQDYSDVAYWKPIASGCEESEYGYRSPDEVDILDGTELEPSDVESTFRFDAPLSPDRAAAKEDRSIDPDKVLKDWDRIKTDYNAVVTEGIGGVAVPFTPDYDVSNLVADLDIPTLLVVSSRLGTISHTRTAVNFLKEPETPSGILLTPDSGQSIESLNRDHLRQIFTDRFVDLLPQLEENPDDALGVIKRFRSA